MTLTQTKVIENSNALCLSSRLNVFHNFTVIVIIRSKQLIKRHAVVASVFFSSN